MKTVTELARISAERYSAIPGNEWINVRTSTQWAIDTLRVSALRCDLLIATNRNRTYL